MRKENGGRLCLSLLVLLIVTAAFLSACAPSKYQAVDLNSPETQEEASFTIEETPSAETDLEGTSSGEAEESTSGEEIHYQPVEETVVVMADVLNVRERESTDSRIYVQLKAGEKLHRTGISEKWSRVEYDGLVGYVVADMVEKLEEEPEEEPAVRAAAAFDTETEAALPGAGYVVAIDAGSQAKANLDKEPIGPSSVTLKAKMPEGATGTSAGAREYELTLAVAKKLEEELCSRGYEVVMVRKSHDVNLSNAERAAIANESGAQLVIRLQASFMENSSVYGALAVCMTDQNPYHPELHEESYRLSKKIVDSICGLTGTKNRGVQEIDNSGAINWSEIPVSVVKMGFLSNPDEDRWLSDDGYQNKLALGIASAVDAYFAEPDGAV